MNYPDRIVSRVTEDNKIVFTVLEDLEPEVRAELEIFLDDVNSVSPIDPETGKGPFPSFQLIQLETIGAASVLTKYAVDDTFDFEITAQGSTQQFTLTGADLVTYQSLITEINARVPGATATYVPMTPNSQHKITVTSNTIARAATSNTETGAVTAGSTSSVAVTTLLGDFVNTSQTRTQGEVKASVTIPLPSFDECHVLTGLDEEVTYSFQVDIENKPNVLSGNGAELRTYEDIIWLINTLEDATASYTTEFPRANQIAIVGGVDPDTLSLSDFADENNPEASFEAAQAQLVSANFGKTVVISNFDLFVATPIVHSLRLPAHGGRDLTDVIKYSYRADRTVWREIVPFDWTEYWWGVAPGT